MAMLSFCSPSVSLPWNTKLGGRKRDGVISRAALDKGGNCATCKGKGAMECKGCKGTGKNKKNGNVFERWKCFDCQGFGYVSCPRCGKGGLTPEQRGER
ncbi:protein PHOTOSYSTEM I ASSEMBLY 2, chloroplastic [Selaginella moellendorffii]|uniref:protein PHOTOSYSTEM I ASSEMBLY 2, chloroplastic n=1 Tax=Selaginella moellendorffii TaxID=88036 RepID=UPI000D1C8D7A|nr:protein PHOTOSYSTEM I ASSEMBLY 2, chloroplastic [Selaginella moellendorffii]|eukprot:XP_002968199.2 protein PHOTOSYSTEM I ASSEMBLY 2, chloroplastic [Selaginella moellendorffii]